MAKKIRQEGKKRTYLGLLLAVLLFFMLVAGYLLLFARDPLGPISRGVLLVITAVVLFGALTFLCGLMLAIISIAKNRAFKNLGWLAAKTLFFLYPLVVHCGRLLHIAQENIQNSFIAVNNRLVATRPYETAGNNVLLLLPHCLQNGECDYKITRDLGNCRRCGHCQIPEIMDLAMDKGVKMEIVTGGTLARQAVQKHYPQAIVAVACERDLCSGILDSFPLPVYGVINERPQGPCSNTRVNMALLEETLSSVINKKERS